MSTHELEERCARRAWLMAIGLVMFVASACRQPAARPAPIARQGARQDREAPATPASVGAALHACIPSPALVVQPGCAMQGAASPAPATCADLSPAGSPDVGVLSVVVAEGPYDFARALGVPSMQTALDAGAPGAPAMIEMYRKFEGPRVERLGDGRHLALESRGLMLGGVVHWATLPSPRGRFTTVLVQQIPLHDAPLGDADRAAVEGWNLTAMLACIDGRFWPRAARR